MLKSNKGVSLTMAVITVLVLIIVLSTITFSALNSIKIRKLDQLYNDIRQLNDSIAIYYLKHHELPIKKSQVFKVETGRIIKDQTNCILKNKSNAFKTADDLINPNDFGKFQNDAGEEVIGAVYYKVDTGLLDNLSLNYDKSGTYIINPQSFTVYYMEGVTVDKETYHTLPIDYKIQESNRVRKLEYIRTTGNQYIDTGFVPNQDTSIEIKFKLLSRKSQFIYGVRTDSSKETYSMVYVNTDIIRSDYATKQINLAKTSIDNPITLKQEKNKVYINENLMATHTAATFTAGGVQRKNNLVLFNVNTNGTINNDFCTDLIFYYCKIWDGNTLVRDFIPVADENNIICLYDIVEKKLYYPQYGNQEEPFEKGYSMTKLESLACDGKQYIDTGLKPNQDTSIEMKVKIGGTSNQALFGARKDGKVNTFTAFFLGSNKTVRCDYNTTQTSIGAISTGTECIIKQEKNTFYVNGTKKGNATYANFASDYNLSLFAVNTAGTISTNANNLMCYYCKIWDGDTLVRDYIPVIDKNNVVCLYDKVNSKYYYSAGASPFLLGK